MTARFQFMRCGLISLFHYANQVFEAEDGHLLLRGSNGSGKSTAVELVVPLLLDGNLTSSNLSTSDGQRSIVYHLLLDGLYTRRLGYSWAQFAYVDGDDERWVTLALGVKAAQDTRHDAWFAIWDTPVMIDPHVMLVRPDQAPLGRREVGKLPGVELYDSAEDYRARVNALLFGFSERRYEAMLRLMRRLRSAQLGKSINVAQTTELLELALPELDVELLAGVGGKLDELESLRGELAALQEASGAATRFVDRYRAFARGVVARELGAADDIVRAARRESRKEQRLAGERERAAETLAHTERDIARLDEQVAHVQGELRALHASERWRAVEEVGAAQGRAGEQDERARRAESRVAELRDEEAVLAAELASAGEELSDADRSLDAVGAALREACAAAGLADLLQLPLRAPAVELLDSARRTRRAALRRLGELSGVAATARADAERARDALDTAEAAERELCARRDELELARDEAAGEWREAIDAWAADLVELHLAPGEALDEAVLRATRRLAAEEEQRAATRRELAVLRAALEAEQSDLHADLDPPPPLAPWRDPDQPGAPLWRLCDFAPGLDDTERAGLERALEASGLLDARMQDGALRSGHLIISTPDLPEGLSRSLADVLSAPDELRPALRAIAVLDADARGPLAVALDGTFALGPLRGRGADAPARFIGADARQAAREHRIAAIDAELDRLAEADARVDDELAELHRRARVLDAERASYPEVQNDAAERHAACTREIEQRRAALQTQRETARAAAERLADADTAVLAHATEHGLPHTPDDTLEEALDRLTEALPEARSTLQHRERLRAARRERYERHARLAERRERAQAEAATERRQAEELQGFAKRLAASAGDDRDEVLKDAEALEAELAQFARHRAELDGEARKQTGAIERFGAQRDAAAAELERQLRQQDARAARLSELDGAGLVALALGDSHEQGAWDAERITSLSKARRAELEATEETSASAIYREFDELRAALDGSLGIEAVLDVLGDVPVISAAYGGAHVPIASAATSVRQELERQEGTLADQEEQLFEEFLFGDVANELRARISDADAIAKAAAEKISAVRTSSGIGVDLRWELRADLDASVRQVIALLKRSDPRALPVDQRETLMGFFRDRLAEARAGSEHATLVEHLRTTLDYRSWYRFRIFQVKDGSRAELTRRTHSRDSGGEKSVTLHLPLLAAYHALLTGAQSTAPRLVALDEAFAGIDRSGQQQLLEVLDDKFDLDFVLTSEKLWCFEPQVHRLGVYQLRRFEGAPVAAVHWRWWGDQRRKEMVGLHAIGDGSESHAA